MKGNVKRVGLSGSSGLENYAPATANKKMQKMEREYNSFVEFRTKLKELGKLQAEST